MAVGGWSVMMMVSVWKHFKLSEHTNGTDEMKHRFENPNKVNIGSISAGCQCGVRITKHAAAEDSKHETEWCASVCSV
jgi:hypothetical protein